MLENMYLVAQKETNQISANLRASLSRPRDTLAYLFYPHKSHYINQSPYAYVKPKGQGDTADI